MATQPDMTMFGGGPDMSMFSATPQRPKPVSRIENLGRGLKGAYGQAVMSGSFVQPVRWAMEATDFGGYKKKLREKFPGQTDDWYAKKTDELYDEAILIGRDNARAQVEANPYPGQTVGNFVAAVPGSVGFTDLLMPGSSLAKGAYKGTARQVATNVAKHVGKQAGVQGTLGGVEDTIAQGLDIAEGMQDGIDLERLNQNIVLSAALGGAFGAGQAGLHAPGFQRAVEQSNAPAFVKGLFLERGRDLVPETPEFQSQVGQVSPSMLSENITQHRKVLATGTKDDIDAFYNSVGGPRPSDASISAWLTEREGFSTPVSPKADTMQRQIHRDTIRDHMDDATKTWKNKPTINLYDTLDEMSPEVKKAAIKDGVTPDNTVGFYSPVDGQVHLFANQIKTPEAANAVLFHESLGHYGLAQQYGTSLDKTLRILVAKNVGQFGKKVDQWVADNPGAYKGDRIRAAEEVLAEMSEKGPLPKSIGDAVVAGVRRFARNMGIDLKYGDTEVRHILAMAHNSVINGKGRDVIANRFGGLNTGQDDTSRRMYAGEQSHGNIRVPEERWFVGPDGNSRYEIDDSRARFDNELSQEHATGATLPEVFDHPELFRAYPELANVGVVREKLPGNVQGEFDNRGGFPILRISLDAEDPTSVILHEIQHWVQTKEGWQAGGNRSMFKLHDLDALEKLERHYQSQLKNIKTQTNRNYLEGKINQVKELVENSVALRQIDSLAKRNPAVQDKFSQLKSQYSDVAFDYYTLLHGEVEARDVQARRSMDAETRASTRPFTSEAIDPENTIQTPGATTSQSVRQDQMGRDLIPESELSELDRLKANPRFWSDPEYRTNVLEYARTLEPAETSGRFMTPEQLQRSLDDGDIDIKNLEQAYENAYKDYEPTVRSDAEVRRAAVDAGMTPAKVKKMKDMGDLSARIYRSTKAADVLTERISGLLEKEGTPDWSVRDADNLRQALIDHNYVLSKLWDDKAEVARALRTSKMGYTKSSMEAYKELLAEHGGSFSGLADDETLNRFARSLKQLMAGGNNPAGVNALVKGLGKPNWEEYLLSARTNMMLSGMSTHVTAVQDMINGIGFNLMDHTAGLIPGLGREGLRALGINVKPGLHPAEVGARYWGILRSAMDAATYVEALNTLKNGSQAHTTGGRQYARIPGLSKVGDLIAAEDQFFRAFSTNMHLYGLGVRQAVQEARATGKKPSMDDLITQGANYARNPSKELLGEAQRAAETDLLLAPNMLVTPLDALRRRAEGGGERAASFIVNFLLPFVRTATNSLYQRVLRRTPLTMLDPATLADLRGGGAKADIAMGRIMLGAAAVAIAWEGAGKGLITGEGPENPAKKAVKMATGWRPKSVNNEDNYGINQNLGNRMNPFDFNSQTAGMVASLREAYEKGANEGQVATGMKMAMYSTLKSLSDNVWLGDISEMVATMMEPGVRGDVKRDQLIAQQVTSFLPNVLGQVARTNDQSNPFTSTKGDLPQTVIDTAKAKLPGLRETLPDKMTPFGQPVQGGATLAGQKTGVLPQGNRVTGGQFIEKNLDEVVQEVSRLDELFEQSILTPVQRNIKIDGEKIELNNREFSEYQEEAGQRITETIREAMGSEEWAEWDDQQKANWIKKMQSKVKKQVREELYGGNDEE